MPTAALMIGPSCGCCSPPPPPPLTTCGCVVATDTYVSVLSGTPFAMTWQAPPAALSSFRYGNPGGSPTALVTTWYGQRSGIWQMLLCEHDGAFNRFALYTAASTAAGPGGTFCWVREFSAGSGGPYEIFDPAATHTCSPLHWVTNNGEALWSE